MIIPSTSSPLAPAGSASGSRHSAARPAMIRLVFIVSSSPFIGFSFQAENWAPDFLATILRLSFRRLVVANVLLEMIQGLVGSLLLQLLGASSHSRQPPS